MLPSEQRNPSAFAPMHFGTQLRGLHAPCERFASRVAPGTRITRFQLAADLGWMGLDTHRVSNKVSKTRYSHVISSSLTELCPAHALLHDPSSHNDPISSSLSCGSVRIVMPQAQACD